MPHEGHSSCGYESHVAYTLCALSKCRLTAKSHTIFPWTVNIRFLLIWLKIGGAFFQQKYAARPSSFKLTMNVELNEIYRTNLVKYALKFRQTIFLGNFLKNAWYTRYFSIFYIFLAAKNTLFSLEIGDLQGILTNYARSTI